MRPCCYGQSLRQAIHTADLIDQVIEVLEHARLDPRCLKLEITESVVIENIETATSLLQQFRAVGIELAVEDFGTGYSSLSYLHRLPINSLKIDKSFVKTLGGKRDHAEIVKTILTLAHSLGHPRSCGRSGNA